MTELEFTKQRLEDAIEVIDKLQATQPVWSKDKPTVAGWYWISMPGYQLCPVMVEQDADAGLYILWNDDCLNVDEMDCEWSGPLPMPREA